MIGEAAISLTDFVLLSLDRKGILEKYHETWVAFNFKID